MKYLAFLFVFLTSALSLKAQNDYHRFESGENVFLLADQVNVRSKASSSAEVITKLPIGTKLYVLEESNEYLTINGFSAPWYKVKFDNQSGFIWGGLIAEGHLVSEDDNDLLFLYGIASYEAPEEEFGWGKVDIQLRACRNNKELDKIKFPINGGISMGHWLKNYGNKGYESIEDIIYYTISAEMCAGINEDVVIFWNEEAFHNVITLSPGGDAPYFFDDSLVFPEDENGEKGKIFGVQKEGYYSDESQSEILERHKKVEYKWLNNKLIPVKILIDKTSN